MERTQCQQVDASVQSQISQMYPSFGRTYKLLGVSSDICPCKILGPFFADYSVLLKGQRENYENWVLANNVK